MVITVPFSSSQVTTNYKWTLILLRCFTIQVYDYMRVQLDSIVGDVSYLYDNAKAFKRRLNYAAERRVAGVAIWELERDFKVQPHVQFIFKSIWKLYIGEVLLWVIRNYFLWVMRNFFECTDIYRRLITLKLRSL